ncbi:hypothetical protein SPRG_01306, partial [Saprolegnia parasitica CBS 223.65]
ETSKIEALRTAVARSARYETRLAASWRHGGRATGSCPSLAASAALRGITPSTLVAFEVRFVANPNALFFKAKFEAIE